jgi:hypothetical protein
MPSIINADSGISSSVTGITFSADNSGALNIQTNGVTAIAISSSQAVSFPVTTSLDFGSANITTLTSSSATITNLIATTGTITDLRSPTASATVLRSASATLTNLLATSLNVSAATYLATASGNVGIGTSSPGVRLEIQTVGAGSVVDALSLYNPNSAGSAAGNRILFQNFNNANARTTYASIENILTGNSAGNEFGILTFSTKNAGSLAERVRIDQTGIVSIQTVGAGSLVDTLSLYNPSSAGGSAGNRIQFQNFNNANSRITYASIENYVDGNAATNEFGILTFSTRGSGTLTERARITSAGEFLVGKTVEGFETVGARIRASGNIFATVSDNPCLGANRKASDGTLVEFCQDDAVEGTISVSGNTVSYNAFAGSHWSQLQDGSKPDILRGTVMESINELCVWPGEKNERLPKSKISDTAGSKKVYGVFMAWDNDWTTTNDMYVTAVGAFICRVNGSVTVQEGDLLESNGDGTARVQADDIIRSSTIGKVTSTVKTHEYDDGSYCVPTVLYCG